MVRVVPAEASAHVQSHGLTDPLDLLASALFAAGANDPALLQRSHGAAREAYAGTIPTATVIYI